MVKCIGRGSAMLRTEGYSASALEASITRYYLNALTTAQVLEELIQLARDIRAAVSEAEDNVNIVAAVRKPIRACLRRVIVYLVRPFNQNGSGAFL
jgi:hypothetical protein